MLRRVLSLSGGLLALAASASHAQAGFWEPPAPPPEPPPIHVYDYSRGPVWTSNGWAYVPVEVHFPRTRPTVIVPPQNVDRGPPPLRRVRERRRDADFDAKPPLPSMRELGLPPPPAPRRKANLK
jgi:hypothetical protein